VEATLDTEALAAMLDACFAIIVSAAAAAPPIHAGNQSLRFSASERNVINGNIRAAYTMPEITNIRKSENFRTMNKIRFC